MKKWISIILITIALLLWWLSRNRVEVSTPLTYCDMRAEKRSQALSWAALHIFTMRQKSLCYCSQIVEALKDGEFEDDLLYVTVSDINYMIAWYGGRYSFKHIVHHREGDVSYITCLRYSFPVA